MNNFVFPQSGYPMDDFQKKMMEIIINLHTDLGSLDKANDVLFRMFEISFPHATEQEKKEFTRVQGAIRCINQLIAQESEIFQDLILEKQSYEVPEFD